MIKAILLHSKNKTITEVEIRGGDIQDIYRFLEVDQFEAVGLGEINGVFVSMYVDEEGLLKEAYIEEDGTKHNMFGMKLKGFPNVIMGNGLIMGTDEEGESVDSPLSVSQVESLVTFVEYDDPKDRPEPYIEFMSF
jgi:hypothetical protein